ncbi:MAG TPA: sugar phosphate isomerase/epimerase [Candidatus Saccharimonadales bacterium]|jgi:sugar phosphate isomerase/epimerase|nr:sugar phosphate isomerase/epimerase [Candidatus Saccharimonadales bacterium]
MNIRAAHEREDSMDTISRREMLLTPVVIAASGAIGGAAVGKKMTLAMHQNTSNAAGYRKSLEGWARAGIKDVEITNVLLDEFLKTDDLAAARRVITDLGLNLVHAATGVIELWEPNPNRATALDNLKKRCEMYANMGLHAVYSPTTCTKKVADEDYKAAPDNMYDAGEVAKQFDMKLRIEFMRASTFISTLPTMLKLTRAAAHPNIEPMLDCYHFWSGLNKLEDLDMIRVGEIGHVHFQDVPDMPREMLDLYSRIIPGDGVAPLTRILGKLSEKGYAGPLSVELFLPQFQQGDPYEIAREIRTKSEPVMHQAGVG